MKASELVTAYNSPARPVTTPRDKVGRKARNLYKKLKNWRAVGAEMKVSGGMAYRLANDPNYEPKAPHYRLILGLPALIPTPACEQCGDVHVSRRCPNVAGRKRPRRIAIRCDDMESAAATIKRNLEPEQVALLIEILSEDGLFESPKCVGEIGGG